MLSITYTEPDISPARDLLADECLTWCRSNGYADVADNIVLDLDRLREAIAAFLAARYAGGEQ